LNGDTYVFHLLLFPIYDRKLPSLFDRSCIGMVKHIYYNIILKCYYIVYILNNLFMQAHLKLLKWITKFEVYMQGLNAKYSNVHD